MIRSTRNATVLSTYVHVAFMYVQECQTFLFTPDKDWYPLVRIQNTILFDAENLWQEISFQIFNLVLDMENLDQFTLYLHQHKDILPECTEPYGQFNIKINGPTRNGTLQDRWFVIKDFMNNGLPRPELPCQKVDEEEKLGYEGGIGKCLYGE